MAVKLDISKAYDKVEWEFLKRSCLDWAYRRNGLTWHWRPYAQPLTPSSSMENLQVSSLHPRSICQGDPLSPYLFLLC